MKLILSQITTKAMNFRVLWVSFLRRDLQVSERAEFVNDIGDCASQPKVADVQETNLIANTLELGGDRYARHRKVERFQRAIGRLETAEIAEKRAEQRHVAEPRRRFNARITRLDHAHAMTRREYYAAGSAKLHEFCETFTIK
jgi:hypothetical protein